MIDIIVISLFDGLSGGRLVFKDTKFNVLRYYSSEIDKHAIAVANYNFPQDTPYRLWNIIDINVDKLKMEINRDFPWVPVILIGGSPCQGFSMAGKRKWSTTKEWIEVVSLEQYLQLKKEWFEFEWQSYLFWEYERIRKELQPDYFLLENVKMQNKWANMFNKTLGYSPILFNSHLLSAQNRQRYYWFNFKDIWLPVDKWIVLNDILLPEFEQKRFYTWKCHPRDKKSNRGVCGHYRNASDINSIYESNLRIYSKDRKSPTVLTNGNIKIGMEEKEEKEKKEYKYRFLDIIELERLQTLPDNYTKYGRYGKEIKKISPSLRKKMIGNWWTIDVVKYIFKGLENELS